MERANSSRMARVIISPPGFASVCGSCCGWTRLAPTTHKSKLRGMRHTLKFLFMGALRPNLFQGLGESAPAPGISLFSRSEERRVGKECRFRWWLCNEQGKKEYV